MSLQPAWVHARARRFVALLRRPHVLEDLGGAMPIAVLSRLAGMACAFLRATDVEAVVRDGASSLTALQHQELRSICRKLVNLPESVAATAAATDADEATAALITTAIDSHNTWFPSPITAIDGAIAEVPGHSRGPGSSQSLLSPSLRRPGGKKARQAKPMETTTADEAGTQHDDEADGAAKARAAHLVSADLVCGDGHYALQARTFATAPHHANDDNGDGDGGWRETAAATAAVVAAMADSMEGARAAMRELLTQMDSRSARELHFRSLRAAAGLVVDSNLYSYSDETAALLADMVDAVESGSGTIAAAPSRYEPVVEAAMCSVPGVAGLPLSTLSGRTIAGAGAGAGQIAKPASRISASKISVVAGWVSSTHAHTLPGTANVDFCKLLSPSPSSPTTSGRDGSPHCTLKQSAKANGGLLPAAPVVFPAWMDPRSCCLCHTGPLPHLTDAGGDKGGDKGGAAEVGDDGVCGRLLPLPDGTHAHANCLRWSSGVCEKDGTLWDVMQAKSRARLLSCALCQLKGATIGCTVKSCKRSFHLRCALTSHCTLMEARYSSEAAATPHSIHTVTVCPEHYGKIDHSKLHSRWLPADPPRRLSVEGMCNPCEAGEHCVTTRGVSELLSQGHKADKAIRYGSLTVHAIGNPRTYPEPEMARAGFHTAFRIYPHKYRATRVFWSMRRPWTRALYVFEVLTESDIEGFCESLLLENEGHATDRGSSETATSRAALGSTPYSSGPTPSSALPSVPSPVFRVVVLEHFVSPSLRDETGDADAPSLPPVPLLSRSLELLYSTIRDAVRKLQSAGLAGTSTRHAGDAAAPAFGCTATQFFGLGLPAVKQAIELIPDSYAAIIAAPPAPQYRPCFVVPEQELADRMSKAQLQAKAPRRVSVHGSARADGLDLVARAGRPRGPRVTRILAKAVGDGSQPSPADSASTGQGREDSGGNRGRGDRAVDDGEEEVEVNRQRYAVLSAAYLSDPCARLAVRRSCIHGGGLFAADDAVFEKDEMIVEYIGQGVRQSVADRREVQYEEEGVGSCYLFRVDKDSIVDATRCGGMGRFINHSCEPNAYAKVIESVRRRAVRAAVPFSRSNGDKQRREATGREVEEEVEEEVEGEVEVLESSKHIVIFAARDILGGEEITYDYKFPIEEKKLRCYCGAPRCQGSMN